MRFCLISRILQGFLAVMEVRLIPANEDPREGRSVCPTKAQAVQSHHQEVNKQSSVQLANHSEILPT